MIVESIKANNNVNDPEFSSVTSLHNYMYAVHVMTSSVDNTYVNYNWIIIDNCKSDQR